MMKKEVKHWCFSCGSWGEKCLIEDYPHLVCDFCGKIMPIPEQIDDGFPFNGVMAFVLGTNHLGTPQVMMAVLCLSCGGINDVFYKLDAIECNDHLGNTAPWDKEMYKENK